MEGTIEGRSQRRKGLSFPTRDAVRAWLVQSAAGREILGAIEADRVRRGLVSADLLDLFEEQLAGEGKTRVEIVITHNANGTTTVEAFGPRWLRPVVKFVEIPETRTAEQRGAVCEIAEVKSERRLGFWWLGGATVRWLSFPQWIDRIGRQLETERLTKGRNR